MNLLRAYSGFHFCQIKDVVHGFQEKKNHFLIKKSQHLWHAQG